MRPLSVLLPIRRPLLALVGRVWLLTGVLAAPASALSTASSVAVSDSTDALDWARRMVALRGLVADAEAARGPEAEHLATEAFTEARELSAASGTDLEVRSLLLTAQAVYENHFGPVQSGSLSSEELATLRGAQLQSLAHTDPTMVDGSLGLAFGPMESAIPAWLFYPEDAEALVAREGRRYQSRVQRLAQRGQRYFPMIEQALAQRGLPLELKYLTVIESGLNPSAVSPAGAIGLWQILPSTGAMYGVSERALYSPRHATRTAARYLAYLGELFDEDWQLALAAYNCGPGRVQGLVRRAERRLGRTPTFWDIYPQLPAETRAYVPRFIAIAQAMDEIA
ncbi:MAG: transglycosylase SLT domain-containing protein [Rhodothermaceae bacterium]|nr:transglycosylase SLT domain-containing protein [Rhodothermaceae bacterium]